jgi:hypothetical protein
MRLMCVIDREDIVGAAKFLLCHAEAVSLYDADLMQTFKAQHLTSAVMPAGHLCVVLTPEPRLVTCEADEAGFVKLTIFALMARQD